MRVAIMLDEVNEGGRYLLTVMVDTKLAFSSFLVSSSENGMRVIRRDDGQRNAPVVFLPENHATNTLHMILMAAATMVREYAEKTACKHEHYEANSSFMLRCLDCRQLFEPRTQDEIRAVVHYGADAGSKRVEDKPVYHESDVKYE